MTRAHAPSSTIESTIRRVPGRSTVRLRCVACVLTVVLSVLGATSAWADSHMDEEAPPTPPPGTLGPDGIVPVEGATEPTAAEMAAEGEGGTPALEAIGHVPGPGEGVYGDPPNSATGNPETRGWAYDTDYFFAMTRGLKTDTDLGPVSQRWVQPWTFTFDVATLPTAALAGLSGRPPVDEATDEATDASTGEATDEVAAGEDASTSESTDMPADAPETGTEPMPEATPEEAPPSV